MSPEPALEVSLFAAAIINAKYSVFFLALTLLGIGTNLFWVNSYGVDVME
jgi:hypothetical protein